MQYSICHAPRSPRCCGTSTSTASGWIGRRRGQHCAMLVIVKQSCRHTTCMDTCCWAWCRRSPGEDIGGSEYTAVEGSANSRPCWQCQDVPTEARHRHVQAQYGQVYCNVPSQSASEPNLLWRVVFSALWAQGKAQVGAAQVMPPRSASAWPGWPLARILARGQACASGLPLV